MAGPQKSALLAVLWGFFGDFRTSLDIAGSLWSWDGWPPNSRIKCLFSLGFGLAASVDAPIAALSKRWLPEDDVGQTTSDDQPLVFVASRRKCRNDFVEGRRCVHYQNGVMGSG